MRKKNIATAIWLCTAAVALAQGPLAPPGVPAPTMKTLDQIEPRTPLIEGSPGVSIGASGTVTISLSGSYYLTENLTVTSGYGIWISASHVTIDLQGFTIETTSGITSSSGIEIRGSSTFIHNGKIKSGSAYDAGAMGDQFTGPGFNYGIAAPFSTSTGIHIRDISAVGLNFSGITIASFSSLVESCITSITGVSGIRAGIVKHCQAEIAGGSAISAFLEVSSCYGKSVGGNGIFSSGSVSDSYGHTTSTLTSSEGIDAAYSVQNSYGYSEGSSGIEASNADNCYGSTAATNNTSAHGIHAYDAVQNSRGTSSNGGGDGIHTALALNCLGTSFSTDEDSDGIEASFCVQNSYGQSHGGDGIKTSVVSFSRGSSFSAEPTADGIQATTAVGCIASGGENIVNKYLMP